MNSTNKSQDHGHISLERIIAGTNLLSEMMTIKRQFEENKNRTIFFSRSLTNIELIIETFMVSQGEKTKRFVLVIELLKFIMKLYEYRELLGQGIQTYISPHLYDELKQAQEEENNNMTLTRTKKKVPKLKGFEVSESLKSSGSSTGSANPQQQESTPVNPSFFSSFFTKIAKLFTGLLNVIKKALQAVAHPNAKISELLYIVRPLVYVGLIWKFGKRSNLPILVSLGIDLLMVMSIRRSQTGNKSGEWERVEMSKRWKVFFMYLLRDPIFQGFTLVLLSKALSTVWLANGRIHGLLIGLLGYFRYFGYIA